MVNTLSPDEDEVAKVSLRKGKGRFYRVIAHDEQGMLRVVPQGDAMWLPKEWLDEQSKEEVEEAQKNAHIYVWSHGPEPWKAMLVTNPRGEVPRRASKDD